jgi:CMP/dCMP kinase
VKKQDKFIIAMDGTAGSGKSSLCKEAIRQKPWTYINTGILYRATAYLLEQNNIDPNNKGQLQNFAKNILPKLNWNSKKGILSYNNQDIMNELLSEQIGQLTSKISRLKTIREILLPLQRNLTLAQKEQVILVDGRDIATVVFPDAPLKIFVNSDAKIRALRRLEQLNISITKDALEEMKKKILQRDKQDQERDNAPLLQHPQAFELNTSKQTLEESVELFISKVEESIKKHNIENNQGI